MALNSGSFTTALYLAQVASDNYECLREGGYLTWCDVFGHKGYDYTLFHYLIEGTAMNRLIFGLTIGNEDGGSLLDIDRVAGADWNELFDKNGFSEVHKIVYGISSQPLDAEIETRPEDLDRLDNIGLTALWYACWLGNSNHIRILIRHGADVNNASIPPICAAVWRGRYDSVKQLLDAGALIENWSIDILYQALMFRPGRLEDNIREILAIDEALFERLLSINYIPSIYGLPTPLISLAWRKSYHPLLRMLHLLDRGADTELCDQWGLTPLHHAICDESVVSCQILGQAGANANVRNDTGGTILHTAIRSATHADILQALSKLDLAGVELDAKDKYGCTAFDHFKIRAGRRRNDQNTFPAGSSMDFGMPRWWFNEYYSEGKVLDCSVENIDTELQILLSFQNLLQQIQEAQGIPIEDRYPLLSLTRECLTVDHNEDKPLEPITSIIPGAWPEKDMTLSNSASYPGMYTNQANRRGPLMEIHSYSLFDRGLQ